MADLDKVLRIARCRTGQPHELLTAARLAWSLARTAQDRARVRVALHLARTRAARAGVILPALGPGDE